MLQPATEYNLDAMSTEELQTFISEIGPYVPSRETARQLFPERNRGDEIQATAQLRQYARMKLTAMELRLGGHVGAAQEYETICDRLYKSLPKWAKGW